MDENDEKNIQLTISEEEIVSLAFQFHKNGNLSEAKKYYQIYIDSGFR